MKTFQDPIWEEASISSHKGSKKSKKSTFILGGIIGLLVLIQIVFSILNMIENSTLKAKLESEAENAKTMEAKLKNFQSQLESEAENAKTMEAKLNNFQSQLESEAENAKTTEAKLNNFQSQLESQVVGERSQFFHIGRYRYRLPII